MARGWRRKRRRRAWVRSAPVLVPAVVVALVVLVIGGGISEIEPSSGPYWRTVDVGYAALAAPLARQSASTGTDLGSFLSGVASQGRTALFATLDSLASTGQGERKMFAAITPPAPKPAAARLCQAAFDGRAGAISAIRDALEGVVGGASGTAPISGASAVAAMTDASGTISEADASWQTCRQAMSRAPGHARLPDSRWVIGASEWSPQVLTQLVSTLMHVPALQARPLLAISVLSTSPSALGATSGAAATSPELPPTTRLMVHVVVAERGNVDEPGLQVQVRVTPTSPSPGIAPSPLTAIVSVRAGRSVAVVVGPFVVAPGGSYQVEVTASPPASGGASASLDLRVAPLPPPPTTTTTTTTPALKSHP